MYTFPHILNVISLIILNSTECFDCHLSMKPGVGFPTCTTMSVLHKVWNSGGSLKLQFLNGDVHYDLFIPLSPMGFVLFPPLLLVNSSAMKVECPFPCSPEERNDSTSYTVGQWSYTLLSFVSCTGLIKC